MILKRIKVLTKLEAYTNCYVIQDEITKETMVVDPGGEVDKIVEMLDILEAKVKYIYLTHCHGDHIGGVVELKNRKGGKIMIKDTEKGKFLEIRTESKTFSCWCYRPEVVDYMIMNYKKGYGFSLTIKDFNEDFKEPSNLKFKKEQKEH